MEATILLLGVAVQAAAIFPWVVMGRAFPDWVVVPYGVGVAMTSWTILGAL